jgi:hypothetical protein
MIQLFAVLAPLALAAAINPAMILTNLALLSTTRPVARAVAFLLGATLVCIVVGIAALLGFSSPDLAAYSSRAALLPAWLCLVAGVGLLLAAAWAWMRRPSGAARSTTKTSALSESARRLEMRPAIAFLTGAGIQLSNLKALGIYLIGLYEIVLAAPGIPVTLIAMAAFIVIMLAGIELPILLYVLTPTRAAGLFTTARLWLMAHTRVVTVVIGLIAGVFLIVKGLLSLFG